MARQAKGHLAFRRSLVATLNYLLFDDGRVVLAEPRIVGPYMDPALVGSDPEMPPLPPSAAGEGAVATGAGTASMRAHREPAAGGSSLDAVQGGAAVSPGSKRGASAPGKWR